MKLHLFTILILITLCSCKQNVGLNEVTVQSRAAFGSNEVIPVEFCSQEGNEKYVAQLRIHIIDRKVHLNNNPLKHNTVNRVHTKLTVALVKNDKQQETKLKNVQLRVLVFEKTGIDGQPLLYVEEEFTEIQGLKVYQTNIKQVVFESMIRKPTTTINLETSEIHSRLMTNDEHVYFKDLQDEGVTDQSDCVGYDTKTDIKHWYQNLSLLEKSAIISSIFLLVFVFVMTCCVCLKRQCIRKRKLKIESPVYNTLTIDIDDDVRQKRRPDVKRLDDFTKEIDLYFECDTTNDKIPLFLKF